MLSPTRSIAASGFDLQPAWNSLSERRAHAFNLGEAKARRREISADAYLFLYKELVALAGERTYCWPSLDYLVDILEASEGTVKRWLRELERAALIRRRPRPGGRTTLTFITAFLTDPPELQPECVDAARAEDNQAAAPTRIADPGPSSTPVVPSTLQDTDNMLATPLPPDIEPLSAEGSAAFSHQSGDAQGQASFFAPSKGITDDRYDGSDVIPHSFKTQIPNQGGGKEGSTTKLEPQPPTETDGSRVLLQAEGVVSTEVIAELSTIPKEELEAVQRYVGQQRNVTCRPGLLVWLARHGMGQVLLRGRQVCRTQRAARQQGLSSLPGDLMSGTAAVPDDPTLIKLWQDVLASYRASETHEDFATWLEPTALVELVDGTAVIATPNVFVRDVVAERYQANLQSTLVATLGELVTVQLIIH